MSPGRRYKITTHKADWLSKEWAKLCWRESILSFQADVGIITGMNISGAVESLLKQLKQDEEAVMSEASQQGRRQPGE